MEGRAPADRSAEDQVRVVVQVLRRGFAPRFLFVRLNRFLSQCGLGSRRGCEQLVLEGRVGLNGRQVKDLATQVNEGDEVTVDGRPVRTEAGVVIALHKPRGYICSRSDERDRSTIYDLLPKKFQTLHHVGRLDKESEGLILLTNRGDLSHRLIHPSQGAEKEYEVIVDKPLDQAVMAKLVKGMLTEEGHAKAERAWMITEYRAHLVLKQGLKRQIRLMLYQLGFEVERLTRTRIGWLELKGLPRGGWKELSTAEVERFLSKEGGGQVKRPTRPRPVREGGEQPEGEKSRRPAPRPERSGGERPWSRDPGPGSRDNRSGGERPSSRKRGPSSRDDRSGTRSRFGKSDSKGPAKRPPAAKKARRGR